LYFGGGNPNSIDFHQQTRFEIWNWSVSMWDFEQQEVLHLLYFFFSVNTLLSLGEVSPTPEPRHQLKGKKKFHGGKATQRLTFIPASADLFSWQVFVMLKL
jgi:hypothetical protein